MARLAFSTFSIGLGTAAVRAINAGVGRAEVEGGDLGPGWVTLSQVLRTKGQKCRHGREALTGAAGSLLWGKAPASVERSHQRASEEWCGPWNFLAGDAAFLGRA